MTDLDGHLREYAQRWRESQRAAYEVTARSAVPQTPAVSGPLPQPPSPPSPPARPRRRWPMVAGALVVGGVAVVVTTVIGGRGTTATHVSTVGGTAGAGALPAGQSRTSVGVSIGGSVRITGNGRHLLISFTGGPPFKSSEPCSVDYRAIVTETRQQVRVRLIASSPKHVGIVVCAAAGFSRHLSVSLAQPLGQRALIDDQTGQVLPISAR
jgi:hypothetical protein